MRKVLLFDTAAGSQNCGDYIIMDSINRELASLISNNITVRFSTHTPVMHAYQAVLPVYTTRYCMDADYKILCGTNILKSSLLKVGRDWNINLVDARLYRGVVCMGCGCGIESKKTNVYTRAIYRQILSKDFLHSVRDARTVDFLHELGVDAVNTGCPTLWDIDQRIINDAYRRPRCNSVIFTLTDYAPDPENDRHMVKALRDRYTSLYFWPQGSRDLDYASSIGILDGVSVVPPNLDSYRRALANECDYVGTRLHGGIFALKAGHRTLILSVDHRAEDMRAVSKLPVIQRGDIAALSASLYSWDRPEVFVDYSAINEWKSQFI